MKIKVKVNPQSKTQSVISQSDGSLKINLRSPAKGNKANFELFEVLSKYYKVAPTRISIIHGATTKTKLISID